MATAAVAASPGVTKGPNLGAEALAGDTGAADCGECPLPLLLLLFPPAFEVMDSPMIDTIECEGKAGGVAEVDTAGEVVARGELCV